MKRQHKLSRGPNRDPAYVPWQAMRRRCRTTTDKDYPQYGGRGIQVCERWDSFPNFLADMGPRPPGMTIERVDTNGPYEPGNCRWASRKDQQRNKRNSVLLTIHGETRSMAGWAEHVGVDRQTFKSRLRRGWTPEEAIRG